MSDLPPYPPRRPLDYGRPEPGPSAWRILLRVFLVILGVIVLLVLLLLGTCALLSIRR